MLERTLAKKLEKAQILNHWTQAFNKLKLKFICCVGDDGFPVIIPSIQAQCLDREHIVFRTGVYQDELLCIPKVLL